MDIHRCRFVPYPPSTINALAFSQSDVSRGKRAADLRLAIGRANGDIEIWNPVNGAWLQETVFRGGKDRSVDGLVWIRDPDEDVGGKTIIGKLRLFSIGYTTTVTEWDLERGQPLRQSSGNHGEIWCLAAQPTILSAQKKSATDVGSSQWEGQNLVTGCTDGAVVLYSTADQDLQLRRVLVRPSAKKAKIISITFQNRNIVVAGCTDSTIRIFDIRNGSLLRSMSLGAGPASGPKEIIIWAVKCLLNGNIVTGDSTGELRIWDGKTYTLVQRIKSHKQDILSLATSTDGSMILSGGMDRRTVVYKQLGDVRSRWAEVTHRRFHTHDVKTMTTFEGAGLSVLVSGGPDASPIVIPLREFGMEHHRTLPCLPQHPVVQSAPKKRLVMSWWDREVHIWRLSSSSSPPRESAESDSETESRGGERKLVAKIIVKGEANITSASISVDGNLLAVTTAIDVKVFRLKSRSSKGMDPLKITKLDVPPRLCAGGARVAQFSPDGHWLAVIRRDNHILVARLTGHANAVSKLQPVLSKLERIERKIPKLVLLGGLGAYDRNINRLDFSSDSRILAVSDLAGYIDTWILKGIENDQPTDAGTAEDDASLASSSDDSDSDDREQKIPTTILGQHWIRNPSASLIPKLSSAAVILSFRPTSTPAGKTSSTTSPVAHATRNRTQSHAKTPPPTEDRLLVVTASSQILEFEILHGTLSPWSRRNPTSNFPEQFKAVRDQAMGCVWDVTNSKGRLWLYGSSWLWMFDLSRDLPLAPSANGHVNGNSNSNPTTIDQLRPSKKRKLGFGLSDATPTTRDLGKGTSGAGSKIPDEKLQTGISRSQKRILHDDDDALQQSVLDHHHRDFERDVGMDVDEVDDADDDDAAAPQPLLQQLRRAEHNDDEHDGRKMGGGRVLANGDGGKGIVRADASSVITTVKKIGEEVEAPPHFWHTFKYRPIMGIVALGREDSMSESSTDVGGGVRTGNDWEACGKGQEENLGIEVVLVERPAWEMDLPPRYYGDKDVEREREGE